MRKLLKKSSPYLLISVIVCLFVFLYTILAVVRHFHYQSFGFDLGINDQVVWEYSRFHAPLTSIDHVAFIPKLFVHVELIYVFLSPFYWLWSSPLMLLFLQIVVTCSAAIPVFLVARRKNLLPVFQYVLPISYLAFYGIQNALWFDVHSASFGAAFVMWFIYFLETDQRLFSLSACILAMISKENIAGFIFLLTLVHYFSTRQRYVLLYTGLSLGYLGFTFGIYFHYIVTDGYRFAAHGGLWSDLNPLLLFNTREKQEVIFYTLAWTGFLSVLSPVYLIPIIGNLASYFILGRDVDTAQGLFLQYRITLAPLLFWATVTVLSKYKRLNTLPLACYLLICALCIQYVLHLPLSYLVKSWFWSSTPDVKAITHQVTSIPSAVAVVSQNNITPHLSERSQIFTLWPEKKIFTTTNICGKKTCDWFRWEGHPKLLIVDTSSDWDIRHFLTDRDSFIKGLINMEKAGIIVKQSQEESAVIYTVVGTP